MFERSILSKGMRRWFLFIAISATFLVANGFYLWAFESLAVSNDYILSSYYIGNVLAHLVIGLLFGIPFAGFVISHLRVTLRHRNKRSITMGYALAAAALLSLATGVYLMIDGAVRDNQWILWSHIVVCLAGVALFSLHRWASSRAERLTIANLKEVGVIVGVFVVLSIGHYAEKLLPEKAIAAEPPVSFMPSPAKVADGKLIPAEQIADIEYCRQCHADACAQWESSAHANSSFSNIFYFRSLHDILEQAPDKARWCAGCHDPAVLFSGQMQNLARGTDLSKNNYAGAGIGCVACHSMQNTTILGDGGFTLAPPTQYPFAYSTNPFLRAVNRLLIDVKPEPHRRAFLKPFHKTSEFCAACHKVSIPQELNDYKWQRGQNEYDSWHNSGVSWNSARSFYRPAKPIGACAQCHMPTVASKDRGAIDGLVHFHSFPAANTALAVLKNDTAWIARTTAFLKQNRATVDIFAVKRGREIFAPADAPQVRLVPGESVLLDVVVRNRAIGHRFPGGTVDAQQVWVELIGKDELGREFFHNGRMDPATQQVDSAAHFYHSRIFTRGGDLISSREAQKWTATLYNNFVGPGSADVVHYRLTVPPDAGRKVVFTAKLHYKKFDEKFMDFVFQGQKQPVIPDIVMSENTIAIATTDQPASSLAIDSKSSDRDRFNDYGIGLFLQNNNRDASWAWKRTTEIDQSYADGFINQARVELNEGYLAQAAADLDAADRAQSGYFKVAFFRGMYLKKSGRLDEALEIFKKVYDLLPKERQTIDEIGRINYLRGDYHQAINWYEKELAIDPEDMNPHYNMMQCYRALGNMEKAEFHHQEYLKYKDDETQRERTQRYRNIHPADNNEAQMLHEHLNSQF
jgi:hypothetical protein